MDMPHTLLLGLIAGATIFAGLPLGRLRAATPGTRVFLNAVSIGVLVFLVWDVLTHAWEPVDAALGALRDGSGSAGPVVGLGLLFLGGVGVGLMALVGYETWTERRAGDVGDPPGETGGPGAMASTEVPSRPAWSRGRRLALLIAMGIGLHNFGEGLAIGGSAASGDIALATLLVIGFALHNGTEGFGIVAPLTGEPDRPSWGFLLLMGLIGGGPTFLGTAVGHAFTSDVMSVLFLTLAAGSILYVIIQLLDVALRSGRRAILYRGLLAGLTLGFVTDMVVTLGGA